MEKQEKIIRELEIVKRRLARLDHFAEEAETIEDAIVLLKEQQETIWADEIDLTDTLDVMSEYAEELKAREPRVLTLEEAKSALKNDPVIWFEEYIFGTDRIIAGVRMDGTDYFTMQTDDVMNVDDLDDEVVTRLYGNRMRMWTSCPTEEQRKAVKWDA